ncbi:MAG: hypothetical protein HDS66_08620 [Bacteroidales bacterium]|nr:hypothetical protein [Bacteroidales bacterium]
MKRTTAFGLLLAFFSILVSLWIMLGHGPWADDLPYSHLPAGSEDDFFSCTGPALTSFSQLPQAWWHHYLTVNGRLANMLAFLLPLCPAVVLMLCALAFPLMIASLCALSKGKGWNNHPLSLVGIVLLSWLLLPWGEQMISCDYYLNYVASSALNLWVLVFATGIFRAGSHKKTAFILAVIAPLMHEGMALSVDVALICFMLRERRVSPFSTVYLCCSLITMLSPGIFSHAEDVTRLETGHNFYYYTLGLQQWPLWCALIFTIAKSLKRRTLDPLTLCFWSVTAVTFALAIFARQSGRVFWLPLCLSIAIAARAIHPHFTRKVYAGLCAAGTLIFSFFMLTLIAWQAYATREAQSILSELKGGNRVIYRNIIETPQVPATLAPYLTYVNGAATVRANLSAEAFHDWRRTFIVLPPEFLRCDTLPALAGTARARGTAEAFTASPGLREVICTHSLREGSLLSFLRFKGAEEVPQKVTLYEVPLSDTLSAYRPLIRARSLIGPPLLRMDTTQR